MNKLSPDAVKTKNEKEFKDAADKAVADQGKSFHQFGDDDLTVDGERTDVMAMGRGADREIYIEREDRPLVMTAATEADLADLTGQPQALEIGLS
jgi:hypothetical protein